MEEIVVLVDDKVLDVYDRKLDEYFYILEHKPCLFYRVRVYQKESIVFAMFYEGYLPVYHVRYTIEQGQVIERKKIYC